MDYYHGSPIKDLTSLRAGSYVTRHKAVAELMGRYHLDTGKTWTDEDLTEPHYFGKAPKWKKEPQGIGHIYTIKAKKKDLDMLDNPYEHKTLLNTKTAAKKPQSYSPGRLAGYGLLGGLGLKGLAHGVLSNGGMEALNKFNTQEEADRLAGMHISQDDSLHNSLRLFRDYANTGSDLMNSKLFGMNPGTVIEGVRKIPGIESVAGKGAKWDGLGSELHYGAFKEGPLNGFVRYMDELYDNYNKPTSTERLQGQFDGQSFRDEFKTSVNDYIKAQTGVPQYINSQAINGAPMMDSPLPIDQQRNLLDGYSKWVEENGSSNLQTQFKDKAPAVYDSYKKYNGHIVPTVGGIRNGLNLAGGMLIGGGLGAGLGTYLGSKVKAKNSKLIGGIAGGALGAGAGYYLSQ